MVVAVSDLTSGKPYLWKSGIYGDIAVHLKGFSPNGKVAVLTIDGGTDSTPAQTHTPLKDGICYCVVANGELHKRPVRGRKSGSPSAVAASVTPPKVPSKRGRNASTKARQEMNKVAANTEDVFSGITPAFRPGFNPDGSRIYSGNGEVTF